MRVPTHPGAILREDVLPDHEIGKAQLAQKLGVSRQALHNILSERSRVSPEVAVGLEKVFGASAEFWLNLQINHDLARLRQREQEVHAAQA